MRQAMAYALPRWPLSGVLGYWCVEWRFRLLRGPAITETDSPHFRAGHRL